MRSRWLLLPVLLLVLPAARVEATAECCIPVAAVAVTLEISTYCFDCCCPGHGCETVHGETTHDYGGYTFEYDCGEGEQCEAEGALECNEVGPKTQYEHHGTVGEGGSVCESCGVAEGCWPEPPDCFDPNEYLICTCVQPHVQEDPCADPYWPETDPCPELCDP